MNRLCFRLTSLFCGVKCRTICENRKFGGREWSTNFQSCLNHRPLVRRCVNWLNIGRGLVTAGSRISCPSFLEVFPTNLLRSFSRWNIVAHLETTRLASFLFTLFLRSKNSLLCLRSKHWIFDKNKISDCADDENCEEYYKYILVISGKRNQSIYARIA